MIVSSKLIAKNTFEIKLLLDNKEIKISRFLTGFDWMGKHLALTSTSLGKTRLYSVCLCLNSDMLRVQQSLIENISLLEDDPYTKIISLDSNLEDKYLEIYVKKYDYKEALSNYITNQTITQDLNIRGPIVKDFINCRV